MTSDRHQIWHTDREYEYDGAVWLPYLLDFIDNFMRISNFGMGVLHVKVKYWRIFCDVVSLLALVFIVSSNRVS